jgi:hypothetical protein
MYLVETGYGKFVTDASRETINRAALAWAARCRKEGLEGERERMFVYTPIPHVMAAHVVGLIPAAITQMINRPQR